jgi:pSer/pThr/pTyr-binding forkhead associated (FHA) protein
MYLILEICREQGVGGAESGPAVFSAAGGTIGRHPANDWVLADPHVSARHAEIRFIGSKYFLVDSQSSNGVVVNGAQLHAGELYPLKNGDAIFIEPFRIVARISAQRPADAS